MNSVAVRIVTVRILGLVLILSMATAGPAPATQLLRPLFSNGFTRSTASGLTVIATLGQSITGGAVHSSSGRTICHGYWCVGQYSVVGVPEDETIGNIDLPKTLVFGTPWPNPARGQISFTLELPGEAAVRLFVHDVSGRLVSSIPGMQLPAGRHTVEWNASGEGVAAGIYFTRLEVDGYFAGTRRVVLLP